MSPGNPKGRWRGTSRLVALLGPTNTGKTHLAIQRMLEHRTGMMGFPLRLLAREVYDRVVATQGEDAVALVTGEEKRVPPTARYFLCTVEAMPVERPVAFLAIDEIQLCADPERGHVFTDRLLHARGTHETWWLGANTITPLLLRLVPEVELMGRQRLSRLVHTGVGKLERLAPRSAVVCFSAEQVYAQAERLRARHGGAAVVLGALSPRTRNAQVALYQAGEVGHLVATDAIGMGLNLDIHHLALSALRKFDGRGVRPLHAAEVGQIAGRAGRWKRDGTFGTTTDAGPMDPEVVQQVEQHLFPALRRLFWRNHALDFSSPQALLTSLALPPPRPELTRVREAEDEVTLHRLLMREEVADSARSPERLGKLWELAQVPDFSKTLTTSHVDLLASLWQHLREGTVPDELVEAQVRRLDRTWGDIETLMARIAAIRTWTYLSHQGSWLASPERWQQETRAVEDRLSDALHEALTQRFVDVRRSVLLHVDSGGGALALDAEGQVRVGAEVLGRLEGLRWRPADGVELAQDLRSALRRALRPHLEERLAQLDPAELVADGVVVRWRGGRLAEIEPGALRTPELRWVRLELLEPGERDQVRAVVRGWLQAHVDRLTLSCELDSNVVRGVCYALGQGLGTVPRDSVQHLLGEATAEDRQALARASVAVGRRFVFVRDWWRGEAWASRQLLAGLAQRPPRWPVAPSLPAVLARAPQRALAPLWGFQCVGPYLVRVDALEALEAEVRKRQRAGGGWVDAAVQKPVGMGLTDTVSLLRELGVRLRFYRGGWRIER